MVRLTTGLTFWRLNAEVYFVSRVVKVQVPCKSSRFESILDHILSSFSPQELRYLGPLSTQCGYRLHKLKVFEAGPGAANWDRI